MISVEPERAVDRWPATLAVPPVGLKQRVVSLLSMKIPPRQSFNVSLFITSIEEYSI